jgi:hypothetical protein
MKKSKLVPFVKAGILAATIVAIGCIDPLNVDNNKEENDITITIPDTLNTTTRPDTTITPPDTGGTTIVTPGDSIIAPPDTTGGFLVTHNGQGNMVYSRTDLPFPVSMHAFGGEKLIPCLVNSDNTMRTATGNNIENKTMMEIEELFQNFFDDNQVCIEEHGGRIRYTFELDGCLMTSYPDGRLEFDEERCK